MLSTLAVLGYVAVFMTPGLCCDIKYYTTSRGECCPMCPEGTVVKRDCTTYSGTQCIPCVNGTYMHQPSGLNKCFPCTSCDEGLFAKQLCTATSDTICDVVDGYFCKELRDDTGCSSAQQHKHCEPGHRVKTPGRSFWSLGDPTKSTESLCSLEVGPLEEIKASARGSLLCVVSRGQRYSPVPAPAPAPVPASENTGRQASSE